MLKGTLYVVHISLCTLPLLSAHRSDIVKEPSHWMKQQAPLFIVSAVQLADLYPFVLMRL
jgi:hypothetical protein